MNTNLYKSDFHAWTTQQAELLKSGQIADIDTDHLIEELESMGASERSQLQNRLRVLTGQHLKWKHQPEKRTRSWTATIEEQRLSITDLMEENPSLKSVFDEKLSKAYRLGILLAVRETNLEKGTFPKECPWKKDEILNLDFLPD